MNRFRLRTVTTILMSTAVPVLAAQTPTLTTLHSFSSGKDGAYPYYSSLIGHGTTLYGTTQWGGIALGGTVFSVDVTTGVETVLHSFAPANIYTPAQPSSLLYRNDRLFGVTWAGGASGLGSVFGIDPATGGTKVLYNFATFGQSGAAPTSLIDHDGLFYGTTSQGGAMNQGTVFKVDPVTGAESVVYSFGTTNNGVNDGMIAGAVIYYNGLLYGTTVDGGAFGNGTVFKVDPVTGTESVVYSFTGGVDGWNPQAAFIDRNGILYGTTPTSSTPSGGGAIFAVDLASGAETTLYSFHGAGPVALIPLKNKLYGVTANGGSQQQGSVFQFDPATRKMKVLYSFTGGSDGGSPLDLIYLNGDFYGTTYLGGDAGYGTVFKLSP